LLGLTTPSSITKERDIPE